MSRPHCDANGPSNVRPSCEIVSSKSTLSLMNYCSSVVPGKNKRPTRSCSLGKCKTSQPHSDEAKRCSWKNVYVTCVNSARKKRPRCTHVSYNYSVKKWKCSAGRVNQRRKLDRATIPSHEVNKSGSFNKGDAMTKLTHVRHSCRLVSRH